MIKPPVFTDEQASRLAAFLSAPERPAGSMNYCELAGFLFTVASAPASVQPSEWMPVVFNERQAGFATLDEAQEIIPTIMALFNHVNSGVLAGAPVLPPRCAIRTDALANFAPDAPLSQWARGFGAGHDWLEETWNQDVSDASDDVGAELVVLSFFASRNLAETYRQEIGGLNKPLPELAAEMLGAIPEAMRSYANIGRSLYDAQFAKPRHSADTPTGDEEIARHNLCPCGSGKPYKKCCGAVH